MHFPALVALAVVASFAPSLAAPTPYSPHRVISERDPALTGPQFEDRSDQSPQAASDESAVQAMGRIAQFVGQLGSLQEVSDLADSQNNIRPDLDETDSGIKISSIFKSLKGIADVVNAIGNAQQCN
ncbi:hypothetical protein BDR07DRAFT_1459836 [Suillus spraguei]|nr:hypothetical protein BDR07DRAFT_1459836 [Suillus spraguei]